MPRAIQDGRWVTMGGKRVFIPSGSVKDKTVRKQGSRAQKQTEKVKRGTDAKSSPRSKVRNGKTGKGVGTGRFRSGKSGYGTGSKTTPKPQKKKRK